MMPLLRWFSIAAMLCAIGSAMANPIRLDDSLTHTVPPNAQMQWRGLTAPRDGAAAMEAWVRVNVRVDTRPVANRSGKLYLVLDRDESSQLEATWTSQGKLLAGRVTSGERTVVFVGTMPDGTLEDQLLMRLRSGADWQASTRRLQFHFEFDAD
ncbi:MAG: hypothetical protein KF871_00835 [Hydrogenophaga sp.]|uniref:hypothetical protein n=1 Tax=Hydrogenophaga sp. TaxID=1904254 RepID=UPI001D73677D|nr:hypothetical protein [Hydrogenophaga sp.]MBX3608412.1 hypothetical protein [Hydrogenophaga sp.]